MKHRILCTTSLSTMLFASAVSAQTAGTTLELTATNTADVRSGGVSLAVPGQDPTALVEGLRGDGSSATATATGAQSSASSVGVNAPVRGPIGGFGVTTQTSINSGAVTADTRIDVGRDSTGRGSSATSGATGASAFAGVTSINDNLSIDVSNTPQFDNITQTTVNEGVITNTTSSGITVGSARGGRGYSQAVTAQGSSATVGFQSVNGSGFSGVAGDVTQSSTNNGNIVAEGGAVIFREASTNSHGISGSVSANGASSFVALSTNGTTAVGGLSVGATNQETLNNGSVENTGGQARVRVGGSTIGGAGSSMSVTATGAASGVSELQLQGNQAQGSFSDFGQINSSTINTGVVMVEDGSAAAKSVLTDPGSRFNAETVGSSVTVGAQGAVASVSSTTLNRSIGQPGFASGDFAGIDATVSNSGEVSNINGRATAINSLGAGSSASVSAVGAAASVSRNTLDGVSVTGGAFGEIASSVTNTGAVAVIGGSATSTGVVNGASASVSVGASGASNSVGAGAVGRVNSGRPTEAVLPAFDDQTVTTTNQATVDVSNATVSAGFVSGMSAGVGANANGASTSFGLSGVNSTANGTTSGDVTQTTTNQGRSTFLFGDTSTGTVTLSDANVTATGVSGNGASVSAGASGALSSVGLSQAGVGSVNIGDFGTIDQTTSNGPGTGFFGAFVSAPINVTAANVSAGEVSGAAASASVSAMGAGATVQMVANGGNLAVGTVDQLNQNVNQGGLFALTPVTVAGAVVETTNLSGNSASASIGATSANASVGVLNIGDGETTVQGIGPVSQVSTSLRAPVSVDGNLNTGDVSGVAASGAVSASGATATVGVSNVNRFDSTIGFQTISQTTDNLLTEVETSGEITAGEISGFGAGVGLSASGSGASVGLANINSSGTITTTFGAITQTASNVLAPISTDGVVQTGGLVGTGASVNVSASGASASVSGTNVVGSAPMLTYGPINQDATNTGSPVVADGNVTTGDIIGTGAASSIAGRGASSGVALTQINGMASLDGNLGAISQTTTNTVASPVTVSGSITARDITGTAASASIVASGASSGVSTTSIASMAPMIVTAQSITQDTTNNAAVTNTGVITAGNLGTGASVSISAVGASSSVSFTTIGTSLP